MKNKNELYLFEREYKIVKSDRKNTNSVKIDFLAKVMGKEFLEELCDSIPEVSSFIEGLEFKDEFPKCFKNIQKGYYNGWAYKEVERFLEKRQVCFSKFYMKYLMQGLMYLKGEINNKEINYVGIIESFLDTILKKMQKVSIRILIYEIQYQKQNSRLQGKNSEEEYEYFLNDIMDEKWQNKLEQKYPIMRRSIYEIIQSCSKLYIDAINNLYSDKAEIQRELCDNIAFSEIISIDGDIADSHCGGKSVLKFYLDNGKEIFYKPHNIQNESIFYNFMYWLNEAIGENIYNPILVMSENYGWVECIKNNACSNETQLQNYYRRIGIYIFALYLLKTNDIHNENIIACGEYPVIVDLENIIGSPRWAEKDQAIVKKVQLFLDNSVLNLGILPNFKWSYAGANINVSGLGGRGNSILPFMLPRVINGNTSDIKIEYYQPSLDDVENVPVLKGEKVNPTNYLKYIIDGFELIYKWAEQNKKSLKEQLMLFSNLTSRYLLADTQRYAMCLNSSYNPLLMDDGGMRQLYLYTMWYGRDMDSPLDREIVNSEIKDLLQHDIPYFYFKVSGKELYNSRGEAIGEYFDKAPFTELLEKVETLNEQDMNHQLKLIEMTVSLQEKVDVDLTNKQIEKDLIPKDLFLSREQLTCIAEKIGCHILNNAICFKGGDIGWYTASVTTRGEFSWKIQPIDMYMYGGVMGISMFFHKLNDYDNDSTYRHTCEILTSQLFDYTDDMLSKEDIKESSGLYSGETSILYGYLYIYRITKERIYLEYAEKHAGIVKKCMRQEDNFDLLDGLAGAVVGLMELYAVKNSEEVLEAAIEGCNKLLDSAISTPQGLCWKNRLDDVPLLGISHGTAGIMIAFAKLYEVTGRVKYYDAMAGALAYEDANYDDELQNWIDFRANPDKRMEADTVAWCHGAGGILMSRLAVLDIVKDDLKDVVHRDIERAAVKLEEKWMREGLCLCHGSCGNLLMLKKYADYMEDQEMKKRILAYTGQLAYLIEKGEWLLQEQYNPGLMNGYTGIGLCMMELSK